MVQGDTRNARSAPPSRTARAAELSGFLRARRMRLAPRDVGLPTTSNRRVSGLRREEVALLADVGITWYTWLEQGRPIRVAPETLARIADALRLDTDERAYLAKLTAPPAARSDAPAVLPPTVAALLDAVGAPPAYVLTASWNLVGWNRACEALYDLSTIAAEERNILRIKFTSDVPELHLRGWKERARQIVAMFRLEYVDHVGEPAYEELIAELRERSGLFAEIWDLGEVASPVTSTRGVLIHPQAGTLTYDTVDFPIPDAPDLTLTFHVFDSADGSRARFDAFLQLQR